jgi:hypothetical protein
MENYKQAAEHDFYSSTITISISSTHQILAVMVVFQPLKTVNLVRLYGTDLVHLRNSNLRFISYIKVQSRIVANSPVLAVLPVLEQSPVYWAPITL